MDLGTLTATLGADLGPLQQSVAKANATIRTFGSQVSASFNSIKNSVMILNGVFAGMASMGAIELMKIGATALQVESSFAIMADEVGVDAERMISSMKKATRATIDDSDLMAKATKLMLQGYNPEQIERFSKVAITASMYAGTTVAEAFDRLGDSIANKMPKAMKQFGAIFPEQMKLVQKAIAGGADEVVLFNLAMANLELKEAQLRGTQNEATLALQKFNAQLHETGETIGKSLIWLIQKLYGVFQGAASAALLLAGGIVKIAAGVAFLTSKLPGKRGEQGAKDYAALTADAKVFFDSSEDLAKKANGNITGLSSAGTRASKEEIAALENKRKAIEKTLQGYSDSADAQKEILKSLTQSNKDMYDAAIEDADHYAKMQVLAGQNELASAIDVINKKETALDTWYSAQSDAISKNSKNALASTEAMKALDSDYYKQKQKLENDKSETFVKVSNFIRDTNEAMYNDINQYSKQSIDAQIAGVNRWAEAQKVPGANLLLIEQDRLDKIEKLNNNATNAIADSFISAYNEIAQSMITSFSDAEGYSNAALQKQLDKFRTQKSEMIKAGWTEEDWNAWFGMKEFEATLQEQVFLIKKSFDDLIGPDQLAREVTDKAQLEGLEHLEQSSNDVSVGVQAAFLRMSMSAMTFSRMADEAITEFANNAKSTLSTVFLDLAGGKLKSFMDYFTSFAEAMKKKWADMCSQMVVDWIAAQMKMMVAQSGGSWIGKILGLAVGGITGGGIGGSGSTLSGVGANISSGWNTGGFSLDSAMALGQRHAGGIVGMSYAPTRYLPASMVYSAPRFHHGLRSDEFPTILQKGETVIPAGGKAVSKEATDSRMGIDITLDPGLIAKVRQSPEEIDLIIATKYKTGGHIRSAINNK